MGGAFENADEEDATLLLKLKLCCRRTNAPLELVFPPPSPKRPSPTTLTVPAANAAAATPAASAVGKMDTGAGSGGSWDARK